MKLLTASGSSPLTTTSILTSLSRRILTSSLNISKDVTLWQMSSGINSLLPRKSREPRTMHTVIRPSNISRAETKYTTLSGRQNLTECSQTTKSLVSSGRLNMTERLPMMPQITNIVMRYSVIRKSRTSSRRVTTTRSLLISRVETAWLTSSGTNSLQNSRHRMRQITNIVKMHLTIRKSRMQSITSIAKMLLRRIRDSITSLSIGRRKSTTSSMVMKVTTPSRML